MFDFENSVEDQTRNFLERPKGLVHQQQIGLYDQAAANKRGEKFDSSVDRGEPFVFMLGAGRVIRGWDEGVVGMRVGGKRELMIPADLGYGTKGAGGVIPPGASLVFEVELLDIRR